MLDEVALRRADFLPGPSIHLADGRPWTFPGPHGSVPGLDPDYAATVAAVGEAEDEVERLRAELALAIYLLEWNYDLTPDDLTALLVYRPGDPALAVMQEAFRRVAREHTYPTRPTSGTAAPGVGLAPGVVAAPGSGSRWWRAPSTCIRPTLLRMAAWLQDHVSRHLGPPTSSMMG